MTKKKTKVLYQTGLLILVAIIVLIGMGCQKKAPRQVVTARFTDPIYLEPQVSDKCIACHTKTHPINKLATRVSATAETGG
ncbi:MAG: hypothetical protein WCY53_05580 [Sphaerochaetaceae bacterium]